MSELDEREVRSDVTEVLVRYASGIDRRDWERFRSCFTDDCVADYGPFGSWYSADEITTWMAEVHEQFGHTLHRLTNFDVRLSETGATARCYVDVILMSPDNQSGTRAVGFYDDELLLDNGQWRIARRRLTHVGAYLIPEGTPLHIEG